MLLEETAGAVAEKDTSYWQSVWAEEYPGGEGEGSCPGEMVVSRNPGPSRTEERGQTLVAESSGSAEPTHCSPLWPPVEHFQS